MHRTTRLLPCHARCLAFCLALAIAACCGFPGLSERADTGPRSARLAPNSIIPPAVSIAPAYGWPAGVMPTAAPGLSVNAYATGFDHPRWIYVLPNGDVLVAETNRPAKEPSGIRAWIMSKVQKRAGAGVPGATRISLVRDADGDGVAELKTVFLRDLNSPFGIALIGDQLYVANTGAVICFPYATGATEITAPGIKVADLPEGPINDQWTKSIPAIQDGKMLNVTAGSNSNVAENVMEQELDRADVLEIHVASGRTRLFASSLRNPNGSGWQPQSGVLWTVVNEHDDPGSDPLPPHMMSVRDAGTFGRPDNYYGQHVDKRAAPPRLDLVALAIVPDYALGAQVVPLGLAPYEEKLLPPRLAGGASTESHGSWIRKPRSAYKVVFMPFSGGRAAGRLEDVLTGFVSPDGDAYGRPVGVAVDKTGAVLVADDVGNVIWRVAPAHAKARIAKRQPLAYSGDAALIPSS
jgi:glucose/arabinose dehydrogenase